uniref:Uncharacterized protein n=1 Tax=Salix viminalis TaxID=40686 RepID=A0A6N2LE17_SALVM
MCVEINWLNLNYDSQIKDYKF